MIFPENHQSKRITHKGVIESLEKNNKHIETQLDTETIFRLQIKANHQRI